MATKKDLVNQKISIDDFNVSGGADPLDLPKSWKDAGKNSSRPKEFTVKLYHDEDNTYYVLLGAEYGGFQDETAVNLGCSEIGTWIQASSLKKPEEILSRIALQQPVQKVEEHKISKKEPEKKSSQEYQVSQQTQPPENKVSKEGKNSMDNGQVLQAGLRVAAEKLTNIVRNSMLKLHRQLWLAKKNFTEGKKLKREDQMKLDSYLEGIEDMLKSEFGTAGISYALGYLLQEGKPRLQKYITISDSTEMIFEALANEFKVAGLAAAGSTMIDKFLAVVSPQAGQLFSSVSPNIKASEFEQLAKDSAEIISSMNLGLQEQETVSVSSQKSATLN
jgi:hypothetical protein